LLTDPATRGDQRDRDLVNKSISALLTIFVNRTIGKEILCLKLSRMLRKNLGFGAGRETFPPRISIMSHIK
jgi:hypothetical protein